jgi:hypothetical protein
MLCLPFFHFLCVSAALRLGDKRLGPLIFVFRSPFATGIDLPTQRNEHRGELRQSCL